MSLIDPSRKYQEPRAQELRDRYLRTFGGQEIPVPVESIAEDLLGLRIVQSRELGELSGKLLPAERLIILNASEATHGETPIRRHRFTVAHELGHWICHVIGAPAGTELAPSYCRAADLAHDADRALEREANIFAAELLMPEGEIRAAWASDKVVDAVALRFAVSQLSAHWRLYNLGLVENQPA
jgi:hypothetical protein